MNPKDIISKRRGRAVILALIATLAFAGLGRAIFSVTQAGAMIAENDCTEYDDSWVDCEGGGGGGGGGWGGEGGGGWGDEGGGTGWEEGGGLTPEEEESIEIESGDDEGVEIEMGGDEEAGGLTPEEEESIEIESGDDGKTPQEREEAAEERMKHEEEQAKADEEFEKEWQEEIEEEEKAKKTTAQRQQDRIEELEKKRKEELTCRNFRQRDEFRDCLTSYPSADVEALRRRCQQEGADLRRDQRRGRVGKGEMQEAELELCFSELIESSTVEHCSQIDQEREAMRGLGQSTTSVDNELISCLETRGIERQAAMERARRLRELQEHKKGKKPHRARARH